MCRLFSITITTDHSPQPKATLDAALLCYFFPAGDRGAGHRASAPHGPRVHHLPRGAGAPPARHVQPAGPAVGPVGGVQHGTGAYYSIYMFIYMSEGIVSFMFVFSLIYSPSLILIFIYNMFLLLLHSAEPQRRHHHGHLPHRRMSIGLHLVSQPKCPRRGRGPARQSQAQTPDAVQMRRSV